MFCFIFSISRHFGCNSQRTESRSRHVCSTKESTNSFYTRAARTTWTGISQTTVHKQRTASVSFSRVGPQRSSSESLVSKQKNSMAQTTSREEVKVLMNKIDTSLMVKIKLPLIFTLIIIMVWNKENYSTINCKDKLDKLYTFLIVEHLKKLS